jgi:hypothetical protein
MPFRRIVLTLASLFFLVVAGCGGGTGNADTGTVAMDSGAGDAGNDAATSTADAGNDAATTTGDAGNDAAPMSIDTGTTADTGDSCPPHGTGRTCTDTTECDSGLTCDLGRCIPQGRATCGGFAGRACDATSMYTDCVYRPTGGDVGTCLSPEEHRCVCTLDPADWTCS